MGAGQIHVAALGATTPLGRDARSTAAAARAGIAGFTGHTFMVDTGGKPMQVCLAPRLDPDLGGTRRFLALLEPTVDEAWQALERPGCEDLRVAVALGLPAARPGLPEQLSEAALRTLAARYGSRLQGAAVFEADHCAGLAAIDAAWHQLARGRIDACLVAAVDTWMAPDTLEWLDATAELHSGGLDPNAWGITPGEGSGALLLVGDEALHRLGLQSLGRVVSVSQAFEPKHMGSQQICIGEGLTKAFAAAFAGIGPGAVASDIYCDMTPQPFRADEFGFAALRTGNRLRDAADLVAPADCWGDVGAASGALLGVLAVCAAAKHYAHGTTALLWTSSPSGGRAASLFTFDEDIHQP